MIKLNKLPHPEMLRLLSDDLIKKVEQQVLLTLRLQPCWTFIESEEIKLIYFVKTEKFYLIGTPHRDYDFKSQKPQEEKQMKVSKRWVINIFSNLETEKIPLYPETNSGSDGLYLELEIGGHRGKATYRWWCVPPKGWEVLNDIANTIYYKFNKRRLG